MKDSELGTVTISQPIRLQTEFGTLYVRHLRNALKEGLIITADKAFANPVPVRVQSSCLFSESLLALDCDCASQLHASLKIIVNEGGLVVYVYDEGRGAGLKLKIQAMRIQHEDGCHTASAYSKLGLPSDPRQYRLAAAALYSMLPNEEEHIELITNNPRKVDALKQMGLKVVARRPLVIARNKMVGKYLEEKSSVLGHLIDDGHLLQD